MSMELRHYCHEGGFRWDPRRRYGRRANQHSVRPRGLWLCPGDEWKAWHFEHGEGVPVSFLDEEWRVEVETERVLWLDTLDAVERLDGECLPDRYGWGAVGLRYAGVFYDPAVGARTRYARSWAVPSLCLWDLDEVIGTPRLAGPPADYE